MHVNRWALLVKAIVSNIDPFLFSWNSVSVAVIANKQSKIKLRKKKQNLSAKKETLLSHVLETKSKGLDELDTLETLAYLKRLCLHRDLNMKVNRQWGSQGQD